MHDGCLVAHLSSRTPDGTITNAGCRAAADRLLQQRTSSERRRQLANIGVGIAEIAEAAERTDIALGNLMAKVHDERRTDSQRDADVGEEEDEEVDDED